MTSFLYHLQLNIDFINLPFYQNLLTLLGWEVIFSGENICGFHSKTTGDLWFAQKTNDQSNNYDANGLNHIGLRVEKQTEVDEISSFLSKNAISALFDTPRHRPEFSEPQKNTYYQIMFESPDKILFEIVYIGKK